MEEWMSHLNKVMRVEGEDGNKVSGRGRKTN